MSALPTPAVLSSETAVDRRRRLELVSGRHKLTNSIVALPKDRAVVAGGGEGRRVLAVRRDAH